MLKNEGFAEVLGTVAKTERSGENGHGQIIKWPGGYYRTQPFVTVGNSKRVR
jgi:hypothetical protein